LKFAQKYCLFCAKIRRIFARIASLRLRSGQDCVMRIASIFGIVFECFLMKT
jgi:hypothetical protein